MLSSNQRDEKEEEQSRCLMKKSGEWRVPFFLDYLFEYYTLKRGTLS